MCKYNNEKCTDFPHTLSECHAHCAGTTDLHTLLARQLLIPLIRPVCKLRGPERLFHMMNAQVHEHHRDPQHLHGLHLPQGHPQRIGRQNQVIDYTCVCTHK